MKILSIIFCSVTICLFVTSCNENANPKVNYNENHTENTATNTAIFKDTTKAQVANLPVQFDSTQVLIHISGLVSIEDLKKGFADRLSSSYEKQSSRYEEGFYVSSPSGDYLSGWFTNLYFDDFATNKQQLLTTDLLFISRVSYLRRPGKNKEKQYLVYSVYDKDSNKDGKIDTDDLRSLYISHLDGSGFNRITPSGHEYINGIFMGDAYRYYFITLEDINKDGYFNKGDKYHYYYIDFSGDSYSVIEYNPLNTISE